MDFTEEGDLVYCNPPYTHSQKILYGAQEFNIDSLWQKITECKEARSQSHFIYKWKEKVEARGYQHRSSRWII